MTPKERRLERCRLEGAVHAASDAVWRETGRFKLNLDEIIALYPDHDAVKTLLHARAAVEDFEG